MAQSPIDPAPLTSAAPAPTSPAPTSPAGPPPSTRPDSPQRRTPKATTSLHQRRSPLALPHHQLASLNALDLRQTRHQGDFDRALAAQDFWPLRPQPLEILQINIGKLCNMTCRHCHVDAGPDRTQENMDRATVDACLAFLDQAPTIHTVDITGGAPELNPNFRYLVEECVKRGKQVIDRCNLTVLLLPPLADLPQWFADRGVEVVCSLPHYRQRNTDRQRGDGTFEQSIEALRRLNRVGYGQGDPHRRLTLVTNPPGAVLARNQAKAEQEWKAGLLKHQGVSFDRLIALNNMPIARFLEWLEASGNLQGYLETLTNAFNPSTLTGLMCRNTLSIAWDGTLYDCDFNQMLAIPSQIPAPTPPHSSPVAVAAGDPAAPVPAVPAPSVPVTQVDRAHSTPPVLSIHTCTPKDLADRSIQTGRHCFGCTAGSGSSCGGALADS
ncbi:MAG: arsenosugar biosynthesis radical SAM (seleno)protein ArsS [Prochlorothrix sp.]